MSWIIDEIEARGGEIPFDGFMELALYHPENGYYSGRDPRYGRHGDYLTAATASQWYPRVVARLIRRVRKRSGPLRVTDLASGDGSFIGGVLAALGSSAREVIVRVTSIERSHSMRRLQEERLRDLPVPLTVAPDLDAVERTDTSQVVHASELFDAQPVARVVGRADGPMEQWVTTADGSLKWSERPPRDAVAAYFARHAVRLETGQIAEANLEAEPMHRRHLRFAGAHGVALVLDYGYEARRLYDPRGRRSGSLATYRGHELGRDPLASTGEIDLTAHVNWDDFRAAAKAEGWAEIGLWSLAEFLVRAGLADELEERGFGMEAELDASTVTARQEVKRLLDPDGMGSDLKVLVQANGDLIEVAKAALELNSEIGIRR
jgi:SAM-dependent MidA family methyltransferase